MSGSPPASSGPAALGVSAALCDGELVAGDVLVEDGRVVAVGAALGPGGGGGVAVPGFLDLHINGLVGVDFLSTDEAGYARASAALARTGVTGYLPTFITSPLADYAGALEVAAQAAAAGSAHGARVLGVHLEGAVPVAAVAEVRTIRSICGHLTSRRRWRFASSVRCGW